MQTTPTTGLPAPVGVKLTKPQPIEDGSDPLHSEMVAYMTAMAIQHMRNDHGAEAADLAYRVVNKLTEDADRVPRVWTA